MVINKVIWPVYGVRLVSKLVCTLVCYLYMNVQVMALMGQKLCTWLQWKIHKGDDLTLFTSASGGFRDYHRRRRWFLHIAFTGTHLPGTQISSSIFATAAILNIFSICHPGSVVKRLIGSGQYISWHCLS